MKIVFSNMAFDVPEKLESAPTLAASSPSLPSVADGQQLTVNKSQPRALLSPLTKENVPEGSQKGTKSWIQPLPQRLCRRVTLGSSLKASLGLSFLS